VKPREGGGGGGKGPATKFPKPIHKVEYRKKGGGGGFVEAEKKNPVERLLVWKEKGPRGGGKGKGRQEKGEKEKEGGNRAVDAWKEMAVKSRGGGWLIKKGERRKGGRFCPARGGE